MEEALYDTSKVIEIVSKSKEIVRGYISILTVIEYPPSIKYASKILYPEKRDYHLAIKWQVMLRKKGYPLPAVDLVIAAQAYNRGLVLITLDKHFEILKKEAVPELKLILEGT